VPSRGNKLKCTNRPAPAKARQILTSTKKFVRFPFLAGNKICIFSPYWSRKSERSMKHEKQKRSKNQILILMIWTVILPIFLQVYIFSRVE